MNDRPRIVFLAPTPAPYRAHFYDALAERLPEFRFVALFQERSWSAAKWDDPYPKKVHWLALENRRLGPLNRLPFVQRVNCGIRGVLDRLRADVVVLHEFGTLTGRAVIRWAGRRRVPLLLRSDTNWAREMSRSPLSRLLKRMYVRKACRRAFAALALGSTNEAQYAYYGLDVQRLRRVRFDFDRRLYRRLAEQERSGGVLRRRLGVSCPRNILFVGRLLDWKGVGETIRAFRQVQGEFPDVGLVIVGDGPQREELAALAGDLLGTRIILAGYLQPQEVAGSFGLGDFSVAASYDEPWGLVVQEAMACGLPVVATRRVGAAADLVIPGRTGLFVKARDVDSLVAAFRELLAGPQRLERMRQETRDWYERWAELYDPVPAFERVVREALAWRRRATRSGSDG